MKFFLIVCRPLPRRWLPAAAAVPLIVFAGGCASPGPPQPPSLNLPEVVKDLTAARVGDVVHLQWTTPEMTTDRINVQGAMTAEICRITIGTPAPQASACTLVTRLPVLPGPTQAEDTLPSSLTVDPPALLAYRVQLFNVHGRSAGLSAEAFAASGVAPPAVEQFRATDTREGAMLEWEQKNTSAAVELDRLVVGPGGVVVEPPQRKAASKSSSKPTIKKQPTGRPKPSPAPAPKPLQLKPAAPIEVKLRTPPPTRRHRWNHRPYGAKGRDLPLLRPTGPLGNARQSCSGAAQLHLAAGYGCDARHLSAECSVRPRSGSRRRVRSGSFHRSLVDA